MGQSYLPRIASYGEYKCDNYGSHCLQVVVGPVTLWFSYKTLVAFHVDGCERVVHENDWGPTTGKHLKWIDGGDKKNRLPSEEFERRYRQEVLVLFEENDPPISKKRNH